jgi:hypothetical protein
VVFIYEDKFYVLFYSLKNKNLLTVYNTYFCCYMKRFIFSHPNAVEWTFLYRKISVFIFFLKKAFQ